MISKDVLENWVIYANTRDAPGKVVVRRWVVGKDGLTPDESAYFTDTIQGARDYIAEKRPGLYCIPASIDDDITIVETWL